MLQDSEIILIREFCLDRAIGILSATNDLNITVETYIEMAKEIEDFLVREVDKQKARLGDD